MSEVRRASGSLMAEQKWNQAWAGVGFWIKFVAGGGATVGGADLIWKCKNAPAGIPEFWLKNVIDADSHVANIVKSCGFTNFQSVDNLRANALFNGATPDDLNFFLNQFTQDLIGVGELTFASVLTLAFCAWAYSRYEVKRQTEDKIIRGNKICSPKVLGRIMKKQYGKGTIKIGALTLPRKMENLSMFVVGKPQQGKTQFFNYLLTEIMSRREKAVVFCAKKEDFITSHYRPGIDYIFCPLEARTVGWSIKNDITTVEDFALLANILAPINPQAKDQMWDKGKQMTVKALFLHWWFVTDRSNKELARITKLSQMDMAAILKATPGCEEAYGLISNPKSQTAYGFYVNVLCDLQTLQLLSKNEGTFSIREWLKEGKNCIFLPCSDKLEATLSPLYAMFLELMAVNQMDMEQDRMRRVWWLIDEIPSIAKITKLPSLVNKGPSYGACFCGGSQSIIQIDTRYSEPERRAILNSCATTIIYCVEDDLTAEALSKRIGYDEREKTKENLSTDTGDNRGSVTLMTELKKEPLVSPEMLRDLPPMNFYVRVAGFGTSELQQLKYVEPAKNNPDFLPHPEYTLEAYEAEYKMKVEQAKKALELIGKELTEKVKIDKEVTNDRQVQDNEDVMQITINHEDDFIP